MPSECSHPNAHAVDRLGYPEWCPDCERLVYVLRARAEDSDHGDA